MSTKKDILCCNNPNNLPLDKDFWESKYIQSETNWDLGKPSPALVEYMQQISNKEVKVLIPGAGNAHEVNALLNLGFTNITVIDIAKQPIDNLKKEFSKHPAVHLLQEDFFSHIGQYDIILEQTFFCALPINLRLNYVHKMHDLLSKEGKLVGLLFNRTFEKNGPPFGGNTIEYKSLFRGKFEVKTMAECYNSIPERLESEVFIIMKKSNT